MLIKLLPQQLVKFWDMIRLAIAETFMPRNSCTNEHLQYILSQLLSGKMQCWIGFKGTAKERAFIGFLITRIAVEPAIGERVLCLDHIYAFQGVPEELFLQGFSVLEEYAKKNDCKTITGMTDNDRVLKLASRMKFESRYYLYREVPNGK